MQKARGAKLTFRLPGTKSESLHVINEILKKLVLLRRHTSLFCGQIKKTYLLVNFERATKGHG
jgi:hypothetical protein